MKNFYVNPVGKVRVGEYGMMVEVNEKYIPALKELDGFGHLDIIWWCDKSDFEEARSILEVTAPYKKGPQEMGIFATRSPARPNPLGLTVVQLLHIDHENGILHIAYIDADDGTPVIDIKPYTPSLDRVESPRVPKWCSHWPASLEQSGDFPWEDEFNF